MASTSYPQWLIKDVEGMSLEVSWHASKSFQHSSQGSFLLCRTETRKFSTGQVSRCLLNPVPSGSGSCEILLDLSHSQERKCSAVKLTSERYCLVFIDRESGESRPGDGAGKLWEGSGSEDGELQLPSLHG